MGDSRCCCHDQPSTVQSAPGKHQDPRRGDRSPVLDHAIGSGCAPAHTGAYKQKKRDYAPDAQTDKKNAPLSEGSLWQDGRPASMLFTDARALHANDLVVIKVEEIASANRSANTNLTRESSAAAKIDAFLGALGKLQNGPRSQPERGGQLEELFKGQGQVRPQRVPDRHGPGPGPQGPCPTATCSWRATGWSW
jgi:hypothetical protein